MKYLSDFYSSHINDNLTTFKDPERSLGQKRRWDKVGRKEKVVKSNTANNNALKNNLNNALTASKVFGNIVTPMSSAVRSGTELGKFLHRIKPVPERQLTRIEKIRQGLNDIKQTQGVAFDRGMMGVVDRIVKPKKTVIEHNVYRHWLNGGQEWK